MNRKQIGVGLSYVAILLFSHSGGLRADSMTPLQTQSTGGLVQTDWGPGTTGITTPVFDQFNQSLGRLLAVDLTLTTSTDNEFVFNFTNASTITETNGTPGPTTTVFGPDGTTDLFSGTQVVDTVSKTESSGSYTQSTSHTASYSDTLTSTSAAFAEFIGTGTVDLPVYANAYSTFYTSSGNGSGYVITTADAVVTLQYVYAPAVPEPSSYILFAVGIGISLLARRKLNRRGS